MKREETERTYEIRVDEGDLGVDSWQGYGYPVLVTVNSEDRDITMKLRYEHQGSFGFGNPDTLDAFADELKKIEIGRAHV